MQYGQSTAEAEGRDATFTHWTVSGNFNIAQSGRRYYEWFDAAKVAKMLPQCKEEKQVVASNGAA